MSIRFGASACLRACATIALALAGIAATNAQTTAAPQTTGVFLTVQQQRDAFRAAYAAARDGKDWRPLAQGLEDYPLYPYLEAAALQHDLRTASAAEIDAYLQRYAGMIPAGANDLDPDLHTVHTMVAVDEGGGRWRISLFQSTPAAFHGFPEEREALTEELRGLLAPQ